METILHEMSKHIFSEKNQKINKMLPAEIFTQHAMRAKCKSNSKYCWKRESKLGEFRLYGVCLI